MQKYNHLDLQDRHKIKALLDAGHSQTKIAQIIGVHKSTISRELTRNVATRGRYAKQYRPQTAQHKTNRRHRDKRKHSRFTEDLKQQACKWLSPVLHVPCPVINSGSFFSLSSFKSLITCLSASNLSQPG